MEKSQLLKDFAASEIDCNDTNFSSQSRDDETPQGQILFQVLFGIFFFCQCLALYVTIAMLTNPKTKSKA